MPSRRRNRAPVEDIEEADATQQMEEEDVDPEDGQTQQTRPRAVRAANVNMEEEFDERNFGDQQIAAQDAIKLKGMAQDWSQMETAIEKNAFSLLNELASAIAETADDGESKELESLDVMMKGLLDLHSQLKFQQTVLQQLHNDATEREVTDLLQRYDDALKQKTDEYAGQTSRKKYSKSDVYLKFRQASWDILNSDKGMPPLVELIPREERDVSDDDDDDDIQVGGIVQDLKCPITLTLMVEPYTSTVCRHSYSKAAIWQFLGEHANQYSKKPCPAAGCNKMISKSELQFNKDLETKIKRQRRREARDEDSEEGEEIIE